MKIAFCTTCRGRVHHLRKTLPKNLADNTCYPDLKFIVVDYGDQNGLLDYLKNNHGEDIEDGRLIVYSLRTDKFRMAHAKNVAHRCGMLEGAEILINLDADNRTGECFGRYVEAIFEQAQYDRTCFGTQNIFLWARMIKGVRKRGISGRIGMSSRAFLLTGGYDERYADWGPDDMDMNQRLQKFTFLPIEIPVRYLDAIPHTEEERFREYPHAAPTDYSVIAPHERTIANYGNIGCGIVFKNFDFSMPIELKPLPTRIFGIGFQKTATTSLDAALKILGFDSGHWESGMWAKTILREMKKTGRSLLMEKHYAVCDLPIAIFYRELDRTYPGSKFILTMRDEVDWLVSMRDHWNYEKNKFRWEWDIYPAANEVHRATYGQAQFDPEVMLARYRQHNADVRQYFKNRPGDLLLMDMTKGAGWNELCPFVERSIPEVPYPRAYSAY
jgi:hypothetical protein